MSSPLTPNALAFIGLCNEYCAAVEGARESTRPDFVRSMLRLLPRIYISATDLGDSVVPTEDSFIESSIDEEFYEAMRRTMETLFGPEDSYLEVFEEDMQYSDTPIAASIAEGLADLFQVFYDFIEVIRDAPDYVVQNSLEAISEDFGIYWSRKLCNVLRALNQVRYSVPEDDDDIYSDY